jgi:hypothetical protein
VNESESIKNTGNNTKAPSNWLFKQRQVLEKKDVWMQGK